MEHKDELRIQVGVHEAKTNLSKLIEKALKGYSVIIARGGDPVIKLEPIPKNLPKRIPGLDKDKIWISEDFDEIPEDFKDYI